MSPAASPAPAAAVNPLRDEAAGYRELLRDARNELSAALTSLAAERRRVVELEAELAAGAAERDRALNHPGSCAHQRLYSRERSLRAEAEARAGKLAERLAEQQVKTEAEESRGFATRREVLPYVPEQRRGQA